MKIEIHGASQIGHDTLISEDGTPIPHIKEALVSFKPDRQPIVITEQLVLQDGHPIRNGDHVKTKYVVYYPGDFSMEA